MNAWQPELVVLTGDFLDHDDCLPWLTRVFAKLAEPQKSFFVLGNHDVKRDGNARSTVRLRRRGLSMSAEGRGGL